MNKLEPPDAHLVDAAIGWLGLGCADDARAELANISEANQNHPAVLEARWTISAQDHKWQEALLIACAELVTAPNDAAGWLHRAYALRRVTDGGLAQAWDALLPAAKKFPAEPIIAYNLSCYACQMHKLDAAREWFVRAVAAGNKEVLKKMALADEDLQPLWTEIKGL